MASRGVFALFLVVLLVGIILGGASMFEDGKINDEDMYMKMSLADALLPGHGRMLRSTCSESCLTTDWCATNSITGYCTHCTKPGIRGYTDEGYGIGYCS